MPFAECQDCFEGRTKLALVSTLALTPDLELDFTLHVSARLEFLCVSGFATRNRLWSILSADRSPRCAALGHKIEARTTTISKTSLEFHCKRHLEIIGNRAQA